LLIINFVFYLFEDWTGWVAYTVWNSPGLTDISPAGISQTLD
jgi:hypothetical protein